MTRATVVYTDGKRVPVIINAFDEMQAAAKAQKEGWPLADTRTGYYQFYHHLRKNGSIALPFDKWAQQVETLDDYPTGDENDDLGESTAPGGSQEV